ncbi:MAG: DNA gyrase C-terminal beta-propeller domain-containing protein, partial [Bacteroidales bacterium]
QLQQQSIEVVKVIIKYGGGVRGGKAIMNLIGIECGQCRLPITPFSDEEYINNNFIVLGTKRGTVKKTSLEAYSRPRANGVNAITIREGDELLEAILTDGNCQILIAGRDGKCVRFNESDARPIGRTGSGVRGINIEEGDEVVGMICVDPSIEAKDARTILVVSENGYGKKSELEDYRITNRGGKGVKTLNITEKTGNLIALKDVDEDNDLMIINKSGITIRMAVSDIRVAGRATQGVRLINIREGDSIAAVCVVNKSEEKPIDIPEE